MIGIFDYTVVLTFVGLISTVFGMTQAMDGHFRLALLCLAISGLCDAFDGKIARTKRDRSSDQRLYGIQLDSLCDVVCFGIFPVMICYLMGVHGYLGGIASVYYCICGVTRLSWFNVLETNQLQSQAPGEKVYHGLPITSIAVILPLTFLLELWVPERIFPVILTVMLLAAGTLFVLDFRIKKPKLWMLLCMIAVVGAAVLAVLLFSRYSAVWRADGRYDGPLIDLITGHG